MLADPERPNNPRHSTRYPFVSRFLRARVSEIATQTMIGSVRGAWGRVVEAGVEARRGVPRGVVGPRAGAPSLHDHCAGRRGTEQPGQAQPLPPAHGPYSTPAWSADAITLDEAASVSRSGDLWLFTGRKLADRAIRLATNSPVNHVAMVLAIDDLPPLLWHAELGRRWSTCGPASRSAAPSCTD